MPGSEMAATRREWIAYETFAKVLIQEAVWQDKRYGFEPRAEQLEIYVQGTPQTVARAQDRDSFDAVFECARKLSNSEPAETLRNQLSGLGQVFSRAEREAKDFFHHQYLPGTCKYVP
jgi:hypothetical protein